MKPKEPSRAMSLLDDTDLFTRLDPSDMRSLIAALPTQARKGWEQGKQWDVPDSLTPPSRVVIAGSGASAIGGEIIAAVAANQSTIPIEIVRGFELPQTDAKTLIVASSFSGDTEEALTAFRKATKRPGQCLSITTGGLLAKVTREADRPLFTYTLDGPPRSTFSYGLFSLLCLLSRIGALEVDRSEVECAFGALEYGAKAWGVQSPHESNFAKQIASQIAGRAPMIIAADFLHVAGRRWATQVNENASQWAFHAALPEVDHNLVVGLSAPVAIRDSLTAVMLQSEITPPQSLLRVRAVTELLDAATIPHVDVTAKGASALESIVSACYLGDWVSLYLAMLNDVDPMSVPAIEYIKDAVKKH